MRNVPAGSMLDDAVPVVYGDVARLRAGQLTLPRWPVPGLSASALREERFRSARVDGEGVLYGQWCGRHHVMCFVTADALSLLSESRLAPTQWLAAYRSHVRLIQAVARDVVQYRSPIPDLLVLTTAEVSDGRDMMFSPRRGGWISRPRDLR